MNERDARYFCGGTEFRRATPAPVAQPTVQTPVVEKVREMTTPPPPTVKEVVKETAPKKRGRKAK